MQIAVMIVLKYHECGMQYHAYLPVVPHKAVAEVSKIGNL
jgi:hypothetical protein